MPRKRGRRGTNKRPSQPPVLEGGQMPAPAETPPQQQQQQAGPIPPPPSYQAPRPVGPIYLGHINPHHPTVHVIHHPADKMLLRPGVPPPPSSLHNVTVGGPRGVPHAANHHHTHHHSGGGGASSYYYGWQQHQAFGEWFGGIGSDGGPWYAVRHPPQPQSQSSHHHQHHHHSSRPPFFPSDGGPSVGVPPHLTMAQQQQQQRAAPNPHFFPPPPPPRFQPNFYPPNYYSGFGQALAPPETPFHMLLLKRSDWRLVESGAAMNPFSVGVRPSTHTLCDRIEIAELKATARPASFKPPVVSIPGLEAAPKTAIDDSAASPSAQCAPTSEKQPSSSEAAEMVVGAEHHQAADHHRLGQEEEEGDGNGSSQADEEEECSSSSSDDGNNDDDQPPIATPPTDGELQQQPPSPPDAASSSPPRRSLVFYRVFFDHVTMHHFFLPGAHNTSHRNRTPNAKIGGVNCGMPDLPRLLVNFIHFTSGVPISHVDVFNPKQGLCTVWFDESQIGCEQQGGSPSAAPLFATEEKMFNALIDAVHMKVWMPPPTDGCFLLGSSTEGRNHLQQLLSDLKHDSHGSSAPFPRHLMTVQRWESRPPEKARPKSRQHGDDE